MRILLTGSSGFIGYELLQRLRDLNHELAIHVRTDPTNIESNITVFCGELINFSEQIKDFSPQYVFHLAGKSNYPTNIKEEQELWESNELYGTILLSILKDIPNLIFVNFTSSLAYEDGGITPFTYYALTKANFVNNLMFFSQRSSLRVFNLILYSVYGRGDKTKRAINYIIDSLDAPQPILMSPGEQQMDFVHVDDVIKLCEELLKEKPIGDLEDIHVGSGKSHTLKEVSLLIEKISNKHANIYFGAIPYRKEEKMVNIAPIENNRFWKSTISFEKGIESLLLNSNKK